MPPGPQWIADGSIGVNLFVTNTSASADNRVLQAGANAKVVGVAQRAQRMPPWGPLQDGFAAKQGEQLRVYTQGEVCELRVGGTVSVGDYLESDSSGRGVTSSTDGHYYGAIALEAGTVDQLIRVQVLLGMRGA